MENIKLLSEQEYRKLTYPSYSSIKDFLRGRLFYYKKYVLKEEMVDKLELSEDVIFGNLVDTLKFSENEFDDRFIVATAKKPTGQLLDFTEDVYKVCKANMNEYGVLCGNMNTIFEQAYSNLVQASKSAKLRDSLDKFKERFFDEKEGSKEYFDQLKNKGTKALITPFDLEWAHSLKDYINKHPYTRDIMNLETNDKYQVEDQLKLTGEIAGRKVKAMLDRTIFNFAKKIITLTDLKIMSNNTMLPYNYLKLYYYVQNGVYTSLLRQNYPDWTVKPIAFVTIDKYRKNDPIIYKTSEKQYQEAMLGFKIDGKVYKGVNQALTDLAWHEQTDNWQTSKEVFDNKGFLDLVLSGQNTEE